MKKIYSLILLILPMVIFSNNFKEYKSDNFIFETTLSKENISNIINFSENLNTLLDRELKANNNGDLRRVVILENREKFTEYLELLEIKNRDDFTYAMFNNRDRNKVIIYLNYNNQSVSLAHHLTLQYMDNFFLEAPQWLKVGIATYYEDFTIKESVLRNNKWIKSLKSRDINYFSELIKEEDNKISQDLSWLLIDYLINSDNLDDKRLFWETLSYLKWSIESNKQETVTTIFKSAKLDDKLNKYIKTLMGYKEYMDQGVEYYKNGLYKKSIISFNNAILKEEKNYSPYYYLGLSYNKTKEFQKAYSNFSMALDNGAPKDITYYSIGLNFYASKDFSNAEKYLNKILLIEDSKYNSMAQDILNEIKKY